MKAYAVVALMFGGWVGGMFAVVWMHGGHFHGSAADLVYIAWTAIYWTVVFTLAPD